MSILTHLCAKCPRILSLLQESTLVKTHSQYPTNYFYFQLKIVSNSTNTDYRTVSDATEFCIPHYYCCCYFFIYLPTSCLAWMIHVSYSRILSLLLIHCGSNSGLVR